MNLYSTLDQAKTALGITTTADDAALLLHLEDASRHIDRHCGRVFFTEDATRYFDGRCGRVLYTDDFLALTEVATDSQLDNTFDGEVWTEDTDYSLWPDNSWPKQGLAEIVNGRYSWNGYARYVKLTGTWGYGDGLSADPWEATTVTGTVATTTGTTLTLSADDIIAPGHTLKIGTEQLYVSAVSTGVATVKRGVNGTTAAAHSTAAISTAQYPVDVTRAVAHVAMGLLSRAQHGPYKSERIGDYQYTLMSEQEENNFLVRALSGLVKPL